MRPGTFARELELDRLDARAGAAVGEYLHARWRARARDPDGAPPLPALFGDVALARRLAGWRAESRRAEMVWRWCALACVEGDPVVRRARRDDDRRGVLSGRNSAARALGWPSFWELGLALAELEGDGWRAPFEDARRAAAPPLAAELAVEASPERAVERIVGELAGWGAPVVGVTLDVVLSRAHEGPVRARTYPVRPPHDVRVYVRGPHGARGWRALAHELGHAAFARAWDAGAPWSLRAAPSRTLDEAVAFWAECAVAGRDQPAVEAQRRRAEAERSAYTAQPPGDVPAWMISDPMAQPAYLCAMRLAGALWQRCAQASPEQPAAWLFERVLRHGAARSTGQVLANAALALG